MTLTTPPRQSLNYDYVFCFRGRGTAISGFGDEKRGVGHEEKKKDRGCQKVQQTDPRTMIQLPSNFSLPLWLALLQSSERNVAQIRVSARWGG